MLTVLFTYIHTHKHTPTITASPQGIHALFSGEQAQLVTSKSSWMEGRMLYQLPPGSPSIPRPYKSRYTCTQQIRHQHRQARVGRRTTGSEHQHRQARDEPTARPATLPPGPVWRRGIGFLMARPVWRGGYRIPDS